MPHEHKDLFKCCENATATVLQQGIQRIRRPTSCLWTRARATLDGLRRLLIAIIAVQQESVTGRNNKKKQKLLILCFYRNPCNTVKMWSGFSDGLRSQLLWYKCDWKLFGFRFDCSASLAIVWKILYEQQIQRWAKSWKPYKKKKTTSSRVKHVRHTQLLIRWST